ncbi:o-succinylbenzoate synthase [Prosthecochloris sp.]|uniref:o-succinylbenzoate synthase n=1 Tax=Prosthecochloris sp. TaxID=290513 RepID=UPI00257F6C05|nr:o-succinylbenzoate synthase [Prosthecochloris sp.]
MKPGIVSIYRYSIPFVRPVPVKGSSLNTRDGLIIGLQTQNGKYTGFGEIAPLPGLHEETLSEALEQCASLLPVIDLSFGDLSLDNAGKTLPDNLFPSVRTGIEMSLLNLQSVARETFPSFSGALHAKEKLPLNALLFGNTESVLAIATDHFQKGYRTFKLKVQARNPGLAVEQVLALHCAFGNDISLRLDSNRSFSLENACTFFNRIPANSIEYIEEPVANPYLIPEFFNRTGIHSALDESLWMTPGIWSDIPHDCLGGIVLKPSRIGSFSDTLRLALQAEEEKIPAIISSAYETGIGLGFYARLASIISAEPTPCGLDTFRQLSHDILFGSFHVEEGCLLSENTYRSSLNPDLSMLELVERWTL